MAWDLIEYNGDQLTLTAIARKEGVDANSLRKQYNQIRDIYKSVDICKKSSRGKRGGYEKIQYKGELLSLKSIARKEGIDQKTLKKYYIQTKDIYKAIKVIKESLKGKKEKIEYIDYKGEQLTINAIAKIEEINPPSLRKRYRETGDIYNSVKFCKENKRGKREKIEYKGEKIELYKIAKKEQINGMTLNRYYIATGDIYEAIRLCKQNCIKKIEYYGEQLTLTEIARRENIDYQDVRKHYEKTQDIYIAIKLCKPKTRRMKIEYNGEQLTLTEIAKREGISDTTLGRHYKKRKDIYEAIRISKDNSRKMIELRGEQIEANDISRETFLEQRRKQKDKKTKMKKTEVNLYDMSLIMGVRYDVLINLLGKGMSTEEIKEKYANNQERSIRTRDARKRENGQTLLKTCTIYGLSYSYIYIAIAEYGKSLEESVQSYKENRKKIPNQWIYEKYGALLRHLMINNNMDFQEMVEYLKNGNIQIQDALEKSIIRKHAKASNLDLEWMEEFYSQISGGLSEDEIQNFKTKLHINESEEKCLQICKKEIDVVKRKLKLFQIYEAIKADYYTDREIPQLLQEFEVTPEEIDTVFVDFFFKYDDKIIEDQDKKDRIDLIKGLVKKWDFFSGSERYEIIKINKISPLEKVKIENISRQIIRFKAMLNQQTQEQPIQ